MNNEKQRTETKIIEETRKVLHSNNYKNVHSKIEELKNSGSVLIMPLLLDLLESDCPDLIKHDVITLVADLKHQGCAHIITDYINRRKAGRYLAELIASCWQSSLDFSNDLKIFTDCFITENFQTAFESFTVIEEMLWRSNQDLIEICKNMLVDRESEIKEDKIPLYQQLMKIMDAQRTANQEDFPDLYLN